MVHPNKKHDGKTITILYCGQFGKPEKATGTYEHVPNKVWFRFHYTDDNRPGVFERSDWKVV